MTVYFVQEGGPDGHIKIGYTAGNTASRMAALNTGNPRRLTLLIAIPGDRAEEQALHQRFMAHRVCGEWFRPVAPILGFIEEVLCARAHVEGAVAPMYLRAIAASRNPAIGTSHKSLLFSLAARFDGQIAECYVSGKTLCADAGMSNSTLYRILDDLCRYGIVIKSPPRPGRITSTFAINLQRLSTLDLLEPHDAPPAQQACAQVVVNGGA